MLEGLKKSGSAEKKEKEEATCTGEEEVKEGPSVEMKQEDGKESVDVKSENLPSTDATSETSTKPPGEKYTPKVRLFLFSQLNFSLVVFATGL